MDADEDDFVAFRRLLQAYYFARQDHVAGFSVIFHNPEMTRGCIFFYDTERNDRKNYVFESLVQGCQILKNLIKGIGKYS
jgi:hypothetical protein